MTDQVPPPTNPYTPIDNDPKPGGGMFTAVPYSGPEPDKDARTMGMLAHLLAIFFPILAPLLIWLLKKDQHPFIDDQGKESLNFQLSMLVLWVIAGLLSCLLIGVFLFPIIGLANLIFCILAALEANKGVAYRYPFCARFIK